jgi:hypothetical protein
VPLIRRAPIGMSIVMEQSTAQSAESVRPVRRGPRWPALAAATYVGIFCLAATALVLWSIGQGHSVGENGVVLLSICLRLVTIGIALSSVQQWGRRLPAWMILAGLWGTAAVQLSYPIAETVVKALILTGVTRPINKGISNMTPEGWFNFGGVWVAFGFPGVLFLLAALSYRARRAVPVRWVLLGILGGFVLLAGLGLLIG